MAYAADGTLFYGGSWYQHRNALAQPTQIFRVDASGLSASAQPGSAAEVLIWNGSYGISDISLSANGQLVAFLEHRFDEGVPSLQGNYTTVIENGGKAGNQTVHHFEDIVLKVITRAGVERLSIPRVRDFAWAPSGKTIAYITGDYLEGGVGFVSTGVWRANGAGRGAPVQIHNTGYDVAWETQGDGLFIWSFTAGGGEAKYYHPKKGSLTASYRQGIHFSPDAKYYYRPGYEGNDFRLYDGGSNADLTADLGFFAAASLRSAQPRGWLDDDLLIVPDGDEDLLIDIEEGYAMMAGGRVLGSGSTQGSVVIDGDQGVETVSMKTMARFFPVHPDD